jgi:uncharacterized protein (DUF1330 family)
MSAYMVFTYSITDSDGYSAYPGAAFPSIMESGAEVLVADYSSEAVEGDARPVTIVLRFESREAARAWYDSESYVAAKPLRTANSQGAAVLCDGFSMPS